MTWAYIWPLLCWCRLFLCSFFKAFLTSMGAEFCQRLFLHLLRYSWFSSFNLSIWCITLIDLRLLKNPCIPEINPSWSWCMSFLMCCWILFVRILLGFFCIYVHKWYWPVICVCVLSLPGFGMGWGWGIVVLQMSLEVFLLQFFGRV